MLDENPIDYRPFQNDPTKVRCRFCGVTIDVALTNLAPYWGYWCADCRNVPVQPREPSA